jgi:N-acetylglucosamine kinase-like BadF-type ATPase
MARYYLGVDGGQSSTTALIADESGHIVGRGQAGPCNHVAAPEAEAKFKRVIGSCVREACQAAGLDAETILFAAACFGFSGGAHDKEVYTRELIRAEKYKFTHDAEIALTGAHEGAPGIVVIAGTGSMAFGRNREGKTARAGGWGYVFGDEGGAFDLVRRALRAALAAEEGWGPESLLTTLLLQATGFATVNQVMHGFYTPQWDRSRIAQLAPLLTQAAAQDDAIARQIIDEAARQLVWYVQGIHRTLFENAAVSVATIGGVFESDLLRKAFVKHVFETTQCPVIAPRVGPAEGAVLEALRLARLSEPRPRGSGRRLRRRYDGKGTG